MKLSIKIFCWMANNIDPDQTGPSEAVWSGSAVFAYAIMSATVVYKILGHLPYFRCWDTLTLYLTSQKYLSKFILLPINVSKNCWMSCKQCRPWSDATFCDIWSGSTLFARVCLSKYGKYVKVNKKCVLFWTVLAEWIQHQPFQSFKRTEWW